MLAKYNILSGIVVFSRLNAWRQYGLKAMFSRSFYLRAKDKRVAVSCALQTNLHW
jgi:hypothetical protein